MKLTIFTLFAVLAFVTAVPWKSPSPSSKPPQKPATEPSRSFIPSVSTSAVPSSSSSPVPSASSSPLPSLTPSKSPLPPGLISPQKREILRKRLIEVGGCNANICFAFDGSGSIPPEEFENEKKFVLDVASVIGVDMPVQMAAVQYATENIATSPLIFDVKKFLLEVNGIKQMGGISFMASGINYCFSLLWSQGGDANKILVLGDGNSVIGANAVRRANLFRRFGGEVSVVAAGFPNRTVLEGIAHHPENVYNVTDFLDVFHLQQYVEDFVYNFCG